MVKERKPVKYDNDPDPNAKTGRDEFSNTEEMKPENLAKASEEAPPEPARKRRSRRPSDGIQDTF